MPDQLPDTPLLELTLRPDLDVLLGRWRYQPEHPAALRPCYQHLANLALATGCRFWLQDLRRRASPDQETKRWLLDEYYPAVAQRLGQRLYVAYLFSPDMHRQITEAPDYAPPQTFEETPYSLNFFGDEGAAIHWLQTHQPAR
ncbi:hypothetical protein GKZ68_17010 [Hymenobacter sp. BRD128]|uniref:hypothetical protein n=1 Tax=Hymenobacter sp. BRD128 TaxID=2675878 RepID=UPI0015652C7C|nr:hypothetical protein [Hymenobacter sp. BRD128]QKG58176.1 hypothetical protein GKZ68_17010 [Hymenobacter sp. BRD128]